MMMVSNTMINNDYSLFTTITVPITVGYNFVFYTTTEGQGYVVLNTTIFDSLAGALQDISPL